MMLKRQPGEPNSHKMENNMTFSSHFPTFISKPEHTMTRNSKMSYFKTKS